VRLFKAFLLAAASLMAIASSPVAAMDNCTWHLNGTLELQQSNGFLVTLILEQRPDGRLFGTGELKQGHMGGKTVGSLDGVLNGDNIQFNIYWAAGNAVGEYSGSINSRGRIEGTTRDRFHPDSAAHWYSVKLVNCLLGGLPAGKKDQPKAPDPGKGARSPGKFFQR
jgi:hypothetical protein